ncbi:MAG: hypothetical protein QM733_03320 [Ilumatobacteraceae bacterium]
MYRKRRRHRSALTVTLVAATAVLAAACGSDATSTTTAASATTSTGTAGAVITTTTASSSATSGAGSTPSTGAETPGMLAGVCPSTIVVQYDWWPESEHAAFYELTGPGGTADNDKKRYTAPLYTPDGVDTGVKVELRAGGPAIGYEQATAQLYSDPNVIIANVAADQAIQNSKEFPTTAIVAPLRRSPQIIMWDPASHPDFTSIADIGKTDTRVLYFGGAAYMSYLTGAGILKESQVDGSYDGTPASFVSSGGSIAQQGYATAEPFQYEHEYTQWGKPVKYQLIADTGYNPFPALAVKPESVTKYADCFRQLVPMLQQAQVDYLADPERVNTLITDLVTSYDGAPYSKAVADFAAKVQLTDGIVANGPDGALGSFDMDELTDLIGKAGPIFSAQGVDPADGLTAQDIATNEFIDPDVKLPG